MNTVVGNYCEYKGISHLILDVRSDLYLIIDQNDNKKQVKKTSVNVRLDLPKANKITQGTITYLVTPKENIYSLHTFKRMKWLDNDGLRKQIIYMSQIAPD